MRTSFYCDVFPESAAVIGQTRNFHQSHVRLFLISELRSAPV